MNTISRTLWALAALLTLTPLHAADENQTTGTAVDFDWEYWNDVKDDGAYWPNWRLTLKSGALADYADAVQFVWTLSKDATVYSTGTEGTSWRGDDACTGYASLGVLPAGTYSMACTVRFVKGGRNTEYPLTAINWECKGQTTELPLITLTCSNTKALTATTGTFDYRLDVINAAKATCYVIRAVKTGEEEVLPATEVTDLTGTLPLSNLNTAGTTEIWVKAQARLTKDGSLYPAIPVQYPGESQGWGGFTINTAGQADFTVPSIAVKAGEPEATGLTTGTLPYTITVTDAADVESYRIYVVTEGDRPVSEAVTVTATSGIIALKDLNRGDITPLWLKVQANIRNNGLYPAEPVTYPGLAEGWTGLSIDTNDGTTPRMPTLSLRAYAPKVTGETTGSIRYSVGADYPEGIATYSLLVVTTDEKEVGRISPTPDAEGTIELNDLVPATKNPLWVKATATLIDGRVTAQEQYPGAAQDWHGFEIDMTLKPGTAIPAISISAANPVAKTATTGTIDYVLTVIGDESVDSYTVWVVTNGDRLLGQTTSSGPEGTVKLRGLNNSAVTELWVKTFATLTDGSALGDIARNECQAQYPGAAEDWTGLSIDTTGAPNDETGILSPQASQTADTAAAYDLQGRRVIRPAAGSLYFLRHADGTVTRHIAR